MIWYPGYEISWGYQIAVTPQRCNLDGISMNIQEENSALYFRVQSEREQTLIFEPLRMCHVIYVYNITLHFRHGVTISYVTNLNDILTGHL